MTTSTSILVVVGELPAEIVRPTLQLEPLLKRNVNYNTYTRSISETQMTKTVLTR